MDCYFMTNVEHCLVTISGSSDVRVWDIETQKCVQYVGHEMSVRALAVSPDNPCIFLILQYLNCNVIPVCLITGGRDGMVLVWDTREPIKLLKNKNEILYNEKSVIGVPFRKYAKAHLDNISNF